MAETKYKGKCGVVVGILRKETAPLIKLVCPKCDKVEIFTRQSEEQLED